MTKDEIINDFNEFLPTAYRSKANRAVCTELYGSSIVMANMMEREQLQRLYTEIAGLRYSNVLDIGCGTGDLLRSITAERECTGLGIDFADRAIAICNEHTGNGKLRFAALDIDELTTISETFDLIIAIDSLFLAADMQKVMRDMLNLCKKNATIIITASEYAFDESLSELIASNRTRIDVALTALQIPYAAYEYTAQETAYWQQAKSSVEKYKDEFIAEGNKSLYEGRIEEADAALAILNNNQAVRKWYVIHT